MPEEPGDFVRILLTAHAFLPESVAGVEVYTARLASSLKALGHAVLVLTATHDLSAEPYAVRRRVWGSLDVVEIVNTRPDGTLEGTYRAAAMDRAILGVVEDFRPDVVHAQHLLNLSTGIFDAAASVGAPLVLTLHDYWLSCPRDGLRMRRDLALCDTVDHRVCASCMADSPYLVPPLQRGASSALRRLGLGRLLHVVQRRTPTVAARLADAARSLMPAPVEGLEGALRARASHLVAHVSRADLLVAPTSYARDRAVESGVPPQKVRVLPLGAIRGRPRPRLGGVRRRFGYVGTLAPHKGVHVLLEAVRKVTAAGFTLDVVGNPALDPFYSRRLRDLAGSDPRIRFLGPVAEGDQGRVLESLDAVVLPSLWWENSPLTVLEALSAGLPVVASRTGGIPEILPEGAGVLVPPGDVVALAAVLEVMALGRLLSGPLPPLSVKTADDGARELTDVYGRLKGSRMGEARA